ncbi:hypothetical protein FALBO_5255 [Fusarium albosuccineum]|uniref:Uncharacterized protein n=1 Tax=Fusarium albosuccineum TaxID=1237068 RepID=A0A8H4PEF4_9HYPO|nr:hypothetical protein FALBO_5255 [Fusarium albosuccineum]
MAADNTSTDTINDVPSVESQCQEKKPSTDQSSRSGSDNSMLLRFIYDTSSVHDRLVQYTLNNGAAASESIKSKASTDACPIAGSIKPDDKSPKKRETSEFRVWWDRHIQRIGSTQMMLDQFIYDTSSLQDRFMRSCRVGTIKAQPVPVSNVINSKVAGPSARDKRSKEKRR